MTRKGEMSRWMQKTRKAACREIARNVKGCKSAPLIQPDMERKGQCRAGYLR